MATIEPSRDYGVVLVLSGGNALGAFEAGVYEALHENGLEPDWIVGTSIGAINGALIAGSASEHRLERLRTFWRPDNFGLLGDAGTSWLPSAFEVGRRTAAVSWTIAAGRPGIFGPLLSWQSWWMEDRRSIFETDQLSVALTQLVDFDKLNFGGCRFTATAVDLATGEDIVFDSRKQRIDARHIRASAALPVAFPPVEVDGRWLVDGGMSANLPLDPVLADFSTRPLLCLAVDLLPLCQPLPNTVGEMASRMQDLIFAAQSRRSLVHWQSAYAGRDAQITLVRLAYTDQANEVAGKALDFSGPTISQRWSAGRKAAMHAVTQLQTGTLPVQRNGLHIIEFERFP